LNQRGCCERGERQASKEIEWGGDQQVGSQAVCDAGKGAAGAAMHEKRSFPQPLTVKALRQALALFFFPFLPQVQAPPSFPLKRAFFIPSFLEKRQIHKTGTEARFLPRRRRLCDAAGWA
jgi:hypothetical protein